MKTEVSPANGTMVLLAMFVAYACFPKAAGNLFRRHDPPANEKYLQWFYPRHSGVSPPLSSFNQFDRLQIGAATQ